MHLQKSGHFFLFLKKYLFIFREKRREGERKGEKHQCVVASPAPPTGDLVHNAGMCPDWESNQQLFASQNSTQSTEPHQRGHGHFLFYNIETNKMSMLGHVIPAV